MAKKKVVFAEPTPQGELTDRIQRLVDPSQTQRSRVSWYGVGALLFSLLLVAALLKWSSDVAVKAAASWMSPKERVDTLVQLEAEHNANFAPPDNGTSGTELSAESSVSGPTEDADHSAGKIPIELVVRTDDGSPIERSLYLACRSENCASILIERGIAHVMQSVFNRAPVASGELQQCRGITALGARS